MKNFMITIVFSISLLAHANAQKILKTGEGPMPDEWIDADTHHKIIKLTQREGSNMSFYFHNNPFVNDKMVFYGIINDAKKYFACFIYT